MNNKKAKVLYKGKAVGILAENPGGGTVFMYDEGWDAESIACSLPNNKRYVEWRDGLHPFFQNLCAEGWLREEKARVGHLSIEDDFGFLLRFGKDCIGAVGIGLGASLGTIDDKENNTITSETEASISSSKTISGVHKKLLVYQSNTDGKFHPSSDFTPATHIAKFNSSTIEDLIRNEYKSLKLAQSVLGNSKVVEFVTSFIDESPALIVKRFDRNPDHSKLRMEEFAQILNKPIGRDFQGKYNGSYEEIAEGIKQHSCLPKIDLLLFFKLVVFNVIIGNCDAHLKNFALVETDEGLRLSPAYDLINTLIYKNKFDTNCALSLNGRKFNIDQINRKVVTDFAHNIGLDGNIINLTLDELKRKFIGNSWLTPHRAESIDGFNNYYKEIVDASCLRILET